MNKHAYHETVVYDNFYEMLHGLHRKHSGDTAIQFLKKNRLITFTYKELLEQVSSLFGYFIKREYRNCHIGILSENRYEYVAIYLASVFENVIAPIDKEITTEALESLLQQFDIKVLFYTNKTRKLVESLSEISGIEFINMDEVYDVIMQESYAVETFLETVKKVPKEKFSVLAFTSGTTGELKGVMLSQYNILSNLRAALEHNILKSPLLLILPMNHTYGFNPGVLTTLYNAGTLCINTDLKYFVRDLKYFNPYYIGVVPMVAEGIYNNILREAKKKKKDKLLQRMIKISNFLLKYKLDVRRLFFGNLINKRLRLMVCGGAALNPFYVERFAELGIILLNGYGLTECSPLVAVNREVHNVPGSVGTIIREDAVKIAPDGEIMVKGPNVMLGYYKDEEATSACIEDGYFKTGDFGYVEGNILYVTGRKKNLIILENGKNFSPEQIENKLLEIPYIKECLVTTRRQEKNSIIIAKIFLEEADGAAEQICPEGEKQLKLLEQDIKAVNATLPDYMHIDDYEIMTEEFEKNSTKKIVRKKYVE